MSPIDQTATQLLSQLNAKETTSVELTRAFLDRIEHCDGAVNAFVRVDADAALARAEQIDARRSKGESLGRLAGLPVAVKDVLCTEGEPTTCGSRILENFRPPSLIRRVLMRLILGSVWTRTGEPAIEPDRPWPRS